jgi:hypothetical protein
MKDRKAPRKFEEKKVIIKDDDQTYSCQLTDISATGISVSTWHFIPTYKEIGVLMEIEGRKVPMQGSVRWSIDADLGKSKNGKLGILILDPPAEFLAYAKKITGES